MAEADTPYPIGSLPQHIAIIMDGNGRWARERGISRVRGHNQGAEALRSLLEACRDRPYIRYLTLYTFSMENWQRPADEVEDLMNLLRHYVKRESKELHEHGVRMCFIGNRSSLSEDIRDDLDAVEKMTAENTQLTVCMAISYGARQEITSAAKAIAHKVERGLLKADDINEDCFVDHLQTCDVPDPDLLIRTGGDERVSNFLLWQLAYTELYFSKVLWPDFTPKHLDEAVENYSHRERRYGRRKAEA